MDLMNAVAGNFANVGALNNGISLFKLTRRCTFIIPSNSSGLNSVTDIGDFGVLGDDGTS